MSIWQILFSFEGRIRRTHWWLARLGLGFGLVVLILVLGAIFAAIGAAGGGSSGAGGEAGALVVGSAILLCLPLLIWTELAITAKRWHDRDKPAVMVLIIFIPFIGGIWTLVECGFLDGTPGPNQYGASPKGLGAAEVFT
ncbi:MAG TPA: DUF805 domain-containing protein [Caulobacteraceae bacterium]